MAPNVQEHCFAKLKLTCALLNECSSYSDILYSNCDLETENTWYLSHDAAKGAHIFLLSHFSWTTCRFASRAKGCLHFSARNAFPVLTCTFSGEATTVPLSLPIKHVVNRVITDHLSYAHRSSLIAIDCSA